jgi:catechol 2,3-dioxygenase-like lactoylglutathione lyase family enzyme
MVEAIDHVEVVTRNMEKSIRFYVDVLKFSVKSRLKFDGSQGMTEISFLKLGDSMLELLEFPNARENPEGSPQVGVRMFALRVADMDKEILSLKDLGIQVSRPPIQIGTSKRAEIKDPNGISIELRQW